MAPPAHVGLLAKRDEHRQRLELALRQRRGPAALPLVGLLGVDPRAELGPRDAHAQLPLLLFILTGYAFLNGLSDWAFWVGLGYLLAQARVGAENAARAGPPHADS